MNQENVNVKVETPPVVTSSVATFGAGCFWCVEAVFQKLKGVDNVESGYMGGKTKNPSYKDVCTGQTGHAEVCQITYNPQKVSFEELLDKISTELARQALYACQDIAERVGLSRMTLEEINAEVKAVRRHAKHHS